MLRRTWVARCDEPECVALVVAESSDLEKWEAGQEVNDAGWQAGPGMPQTYCPKHWRPEVPLADRLDLALQ